VTRPPTASGSRIASDLSLRPNRHLPSSRLHLAPPAIPHPTRLSPLALWHLLSLDAPTVAALWTLFIADSCHLHLPTTVPIAMAIAVWMLYAGDRLLDTRLLDTRHLHTHFEDTRQIANPRQTSTHFAGSQTSPGLEARHLFHHHHRRAFILGIVLASLLLSLLLPRLSPEAMHLDLLLGALLSGYFILIHATRNPHRLPKEFAVGIFFSAAIFIPTVARNPHLRPPLLPAALLFGALCTLNCLFIHAWEHDPHRSPVHPLSPHSSTRFALHYLRPVAVTLTLLSLILTLVIHSSLPLAITLSTTVLLLLDRTRSRLSPLHLRACADLALLTPILFLPFLHA